MPPSSRPHPSRQASSAQDDSVAEHLKQFTIWVEREQAEAQQRAEEARLDRLRREEEKKCAEKAAQEQQIAEKAIKEYEERRRQEAAEAFRKEKEKEEEFRQRLIDARVPEEEVNRILSKGPLMLTGPEIPSAVGITGGNGGVQGDPTLTVQREVPFRNERPSEAPSSHNEDTRISTTSTHFTEVAKA